MRLFRTIIICAMIFSLNNKINAQSLWTIGPMFHYNFGGEKRHFSFAIETAYWNLKNFYYSIDGGIEFGKKRIRFYSEAQTGVGVVGISCGPVLEINRAEGKVRLGVQSTVWANYFIGLDYRYRRIDKTNFHCIGLYGKVPFETRDMKSSNSSSSGWDD